VAGLAAYASARSPRRRALTSSFLWGVAALAVIYAIGAGWLSVVTDLPLHGGRRAGRLPFVVFDLVKVVLAALVAVAAARPSPPPEPEGARGPGRS
jgi:biotin transporter BioY